MKKMLMMFMLVAVIVGMLRVFQLPIKLVPITTLVVYIMVFYALKKNKYWEEE